MINLISMAEEQTKLLYEMHGTLRALDERTQHILAQATKTNGRVSRNEDEIEVLKQDKASAKGWAAGISMAIGTVWGAIIFIFK